MAIIGASKKAILVILDGLGDLPAPKTPLQVAKIPNLDRLAKKGITGMLAPVKRYIVPGSDTAHLNILGYDPAIFYHGRGPLEALGLGLDLKEGDVAFRTNFATVVDGTIKDRRAGRIDSDSAAKLAKYVPKKVRDIEIIFKTSTEHRGALILRGPGLSRSISPTDAHVSDALPECHPLDDTPEAKKTASIVNEFMKLSAAALSKAPENLGKKTPANAILLRGSGQFSPAPSFYERFGLMGACVAGGALYKGVARYIGMDIILVPGATGDKNTDLPGKANATVKALEAYDFVLLHIKMCDSFGHDGDFEGKVKALEEIDKIIPILEKSGACLIVTGDHSTPCAWKGHSGHEVPMLVYGGERGDKIAKFDERNCIQGGLGHLRGKDIIPLILCITGRAEKYGS
ncbi:MAG: 2,3-bisphosphoglycerate-independent phosphoglycerate mutase [Candidatus Micrarchaeota archaeon]